MKTEKKKATLFDKYASTPTTKKPTFGKIKLKATCQLPPNFEVDMIWDGRNLRYEWAPDVPNWHTATKSFWKAYTAAQVDFLTDVAAMEGSTIALLARPYQKPSIIETPIKH